LLVVNRQISRKVVELEEKDYLRKGRDDALSDNVMFLLGIQKEIHDCICKTVEILI
jgi:hypothetical protein